MGLSIILIPLSIIAAVIPMLLYLLTLWLLDWFDREPLWLLGGTFLWGGLGGVGIALILQIGISPALSALFEPSLVEQISAAVIAPLTEEPGKALLLLLIYQSRHFDNASDGFVYGAAAGLGFGMTENFKYFMEGALGMDPVSWMMMVVVRTLCSAVMHALCTSIVGVSIGLAKQKGLAAFFALGTVGLLLAMGIHGLWNGILVIERLPFEEDQRLMLDVGILAVEVFFGLCLFFGLLIAERQNIRRFLLEETKQGVLSHAMIDSCLSISERLQGSVWLPKSAPKRYTLNLITTLGLRLSQLEKANGVSRKFFDREVRRIRKELTSIFQTDHA